MAYKPIPDWDYDFDPTDDDNDGNADQTAPFAPNRASTPAFGQYQTRVQEEMEMKTMQQVEKADTSYAETSFGGAETSSKRAWAAAKDLFPNMSSSELEVSYNTKGKLQVKMFGAGKKTYNLMAIDRGTGRERVNRSLPKEIKNALGEIKYKGEREEYKKRMDENTQEIEKENRNLEALRESDDPPQGEIEKSRAKIRLLQVEKEKLKSAFTLSDLRTTDVSQKEIEKQQMQLRNSEAEFAKARADYNGRYPSDKYEVKQVYEEIPDDEEEEIPDDRQRLKAIDKQNGYLIIRINADRAISQDEKNTLEKRESAKERMERNEATYDKNREERNKIIDRLGIRKSV